MWLLEQSQTNDFWPPDSPRSAQGPWHTCCQGVFSGSMIWQTMDPSMVVHLNHINVNIKKKKHLPFKCSLLQYRSSKGWKEDREMALVLKGTPLRGWGSLLLPGPQGRLRKPPLHCSWFKFTSSMVPSSCLEDSRVFFLLPLFLWEMLQRLFTMLSNIGSHFLRLSPTLLSLSIFL